METRVLVLLWLRNEYLQPYSVRRILFKGFPRRFYGQIATIDASLLFTVRLNCTSDHSTLVTEVYFVVVVVKRNINGSDKRTANSG